MSMTVLPNIKYRNPYSLFIYTAYNPRPQTDRGRGATLEKRNCTVS